MKCGHPDVLENLYWNKMEGTDHGLSSGGVWRCAECLRGSSRRFKQTMAGILSVELSNIKLNARRRGNK